MDIGDIHTPLWLVVLLAIIVGDGIGPPVLKIIGRTPQKSLSIVWQYFSASVFAILLFPALGTWTHGSSMLVVSALGFVNAVAVYAQWRATAISQSQTYVFAVLDDALALLLGVCILRDGLGLSWQVWLGVLLAFCSPLFLWPKSDDSKGARETRSLIAYVTTFSVIWGFVTFAMRYFPSQKLLPLGNFLLAWYVGSFLGSLLLRRYLRASELHEGDCSWKVRGATSLVTASIVVLSLGLHYWAFAIAPLAVVVPLFLLSQSVVPLITGWICFGEHRSLNRRSGIGLVVALIATGCIALGYRG